jgi:protein-disulfide isomerase
VSRSQSRSLLLVAFLASVLSIALPSLAADGNEDDGWKQEILLQLSELRKAQGDLAKEVASLRSEVRTLRLGSADGAGGLVLSDPQYPFIGNPKADIAIVEFSDFECPFCRKHKQSTLPSLAKSYIDNGTVRYYFVDYPLVFHPHAMPAAIAGACAHRQGAFWKMHDALFENQNKLGTALYLKLAGELSLDRAKFETCLADPKVKQQVGERAGLADQAGVQGTPSFLIGRIKNGMLTETRALSGARPAADFEKAISKYLKGS